jgi:CBS domain-containing protein
MSKRVITITSRDTMANAADVMREHSISGLLVVDDKRCTGILSASDFVVLQARVRRTNGESTLAAKPQDVKTAPFDSEDADTVGRHMTSAVKSIAATDSLLAAARTMCNEHIHRLPVLDDQHRPVGMITSLDIVAAVVNAIEE